MADVTVRPATTDDRLTVERLWLMFRHDMSEFRGLLPNPDGSFRSERVDAAFGRKGWAPYLVTLDDRPVGFAFVRGLDGPARVLNSFVVRGVRRAGVGLRAVREIVAQHPGHWEIAFQDDNPAAVRFWRRVATVIAGEAWTEERRPVPDRPELPPDVWISFDAGPEPGEAPLAGGVVSDAVRVGMTVRRKPPERPQYVRALLTLFERHGWAGAPRFLGTDERGREILQYVEGRAAVTPEERAAARTDANLGRIARLVRAFHDLTQGTEAAGDQEVVCHNDLAPKNTVYAVDGTEWRPLAFIDWDIAAPGQRVHDVAHVCWQYLDLGPDVTDVRQAARRIRLICDAYGLDDGPERLLDTVLWWQDRCWRGIEAGAARGEPAMLRLRERGAVDEVRAAHDWVAAHRGELGAWAG